MAKSYTSRIEEAIRARAKQGGKAFVPYIMAGAPSLERTSELIDLLVEEGADVIELGVPFSDPLADGPVIQRAALEALKAGVTLKSVVGLVKAVRARGITTPIILMTYYNPVFVYGLERFCTHAREAGVDGVIIPDLPPDEAQDLMVHARRESIDTIFLLAPTSTEDRIRLVSKHSRGFVYYVSITGITGSALSLDESFRERIAHIRQSSGRPVCLGFGVSTPQDAAKVASAADGVIIGSAIVKQAQDPGLRAFLGSIRRGIDSVGSGS